MAESRNTRNILKSGREWPSWIGYPIAIIVETIVTFILIAIRPYLPLTEFPAPYILTPIILAYLFGLGPGLLSLLMGMSIYAILLGPISTYNEEEWAGITAYVAGALIGTISALLVRRSARRIRRLADQLAESSNQLINILESIADPFFVIDKEWRFRYVNKEAIELLRRNPDDLLGKTLWGEFPQILHTKFYDEFNKAIVEHVTVEFEEFYSTLGKWFDVRAYPGTDALSVYLRDITERKSAEEILQKYRILSERTRDIVLFVRKDGHIVEANKAAERVYGYSREELLNMAIQDIRTPEARGNTLQDLARADQQGILFETMHMRRDGSTFPVEVSSSGANIGKDRILLSIVRDITERKKAEEELSRASEEAQQAAAREREFSTTLQKALVPPKPDAFNGFDIAAIYNPAFTGLEIGGDFYDIFPTELGKLGILIGDVSGKGVESAALAAATRSTVRAFAYDLPSPGEAMSHANSVLYGQQPSIGSFVTVLLIVLDCDTGDLCYTRCGHTPAALVRTDGSVETLYEGGPPIGLEVGRQYGESYGKLNNGDKVVIYTDGISEARRQGEMFEIPRIEAVLAENHSLPPNELAQKLLDAAVDWAEGKLTDDAAIVVIERC